MRPTPFSRLSRRRARGQAVVELVLGLIVFVTILIFAIHFAEVGYLSVKVTEAAHSAIFDATGYKLHKWPRDTSPASSAASRAGNDAQSRYQDFDSRTKAWGKSTSQVFTRAQNLRVNCALGSGPSYTRDPFTMGAYNDNGGINCQASTSISSFGIPQRYLDSGNGFFKQQHYVPTTMNICAIGRGRSCSAKLTMMLDDWGLSGDKESKLCRLNVDSPLGSCDNDAFFSMARNTYLAAIVYGGHTGAASRFAWQIVGAAPILPMGESAFFMSALGEGSSGGSPNDFVQSLSTEGHSRFPTTPGPVGNSGVPSTPYATSYSKRATCWLGLKCPPNN